MYWINCDLRWFAAYEPCLLVNHLVPSLSRVRTLYQDCSKRKLQLQSLEIPIGVKFQSIFASEGIVVGTDGPALFIDQAVVHAGHSRTIASCEGVKRCSNWYLETSWTLSKVKTFKVFTAILDVCRWLMNIDDVFCTFLWPDILQHIAAAVAAAGPVARRFVALGGRWRALFVHCLRPRSDPMGHASVHRVACATKTRWTTGRLRVLVGLMWSW